MNKEKREKTQITKIRNGSGDTVVSHQSCPTPETVARQAPVSMGFSRQEYWSGLPFPSPGDLPDPGTEPASPVSPALKVDS